jgi:CBS domain-containing protein
MAGAYDAVVTKASRACYDAVKTGNPLSVPIVREVMTVDPTAVSRDVTAREAARLLVERDVGPLPVVDGDELIGIVTDRDLVVRVLADDRDPACTTVGEIASTSVVSVGPDEQVEQALELMDEHHFRRLPVVEEGRLVGILSHGDVDRAAARG